MALLILMTPKGVTTQLPVAEPVMSIGRSEQNHVVLASARISRFHASLTTEGPVVVLRDLDSRNGTFLNGHRLRQQQVLLHGDNIDIAGYWMRFLALEQETVGEDALRRISERGPLI